MIRAAALALMACGLPAHAQEFVDVETRLSDEAFYRAVACAAPPDEPCQKPFLHWPEDLRNELTVGFVSLTPALQDYQRSLYEAGLTDALSEINGLDAGIRLQRNDEVADIAIHVVATPPGQVMENTGVPVLDGNVLPLGRVALRARAGEIREATIAVSSQARRREIASILLEEITQALGLMTDVRGAPYHRSVFSEDGNSVVRLEGQDAMALRRHYARPDQSVGAPDDQEDS